MAFDRHMGSEEGAMLVFANTAKEARKNSFGLGWFNSEWTDWAATLIRDLPKHLKALDDGSVQTIESPPVCEACHCWGGSPKGTGCTLCVEDWELDDTDREEAGQGDRRLTEEGERG